MVALVEAALAVNQDNLALGNEVFEAAGARFVRNAAYPSIRDANHIDSISDASPAAIEALIERAEHEFAAFPHIRFDIDARTPPGFEARLRLDDRYTRTETLFVQLEFRHRGLATALLHHCVRDARAHGAGPVVIAADADDTPKQMYAALGWRPAAVKREYLLIRTQASTS